MRKKSSREKTRREFLSTSLKAGLGLSAMSTPLFARGSMVEPDISHSPWKTPHPLNILILGGTSFLGPHQIAYALQRGHSVSIFTRGKTVSSIHKEVFKQVEHLTGNRENDLEALKGRKWDAVIDNSGQKAQWTKDSAALLKDNVDVYLYTSSTGVYYPYLGSDIKEDTKLVLEIPVGITEIQSYEYEYGVMKAHSELEAQKAFGIDRTIIVRPTYMMGPGDRTDRFTFWPIRLSQGGEVMVPGKSDDPVQYIDVRDVAQWMIRLIENRTTGTFNAVGPASPKGMHAFVYGVQAAFSAPVSYTMIPDYEFLEAKGILDRIPWIMPTGDNYGSARVNNQFGITNGLSFTPLAKSARDIYDWWYSDAVSEERQHKWDETNEKAIIKAWRMRK